MLANIVTPRQLLKFGRWATVLAFIVGAIVTPGPEVTSQIAVSSALIGLYFLSIPIAYLLKPRSKEPADAAPKILTFSAKPRGLADRMGVER